LKSTKNKYLSYLKKEKKRIDNAIKDLHDTYQVDVNMGYTSTYEKWLEIKYIELDTLFERVNIERIELIKNKYEKGEK
jgi:hypothetical protein